jgi:hypothetical protein
MASALDIVQALILGGLLLMCILSATSVTFQSTSTMNGDVLVQQELVSTAQLVEGEFRNMGMAVIDDSTTVIDAEASKIKFLSDLNRDGNMDTVAYWLGPVGEMGHVQNDSIRFLHRQLNSGPIQSVGMVTKFSLRYFSQNELDTLVPPVVATDLDMIKIVEISMEVQNRDAMYRDKRDVHSGQRDAFYSSSFWRQTRLASQNLKR